MNDAQYELFPTLRSRERRIAGFRAGTRVLAGIGRTALAVAAIGGVSAGLMLAGSTMSDGDLPYTAVLVEDQNDDGQQDLRITSRYGRDHILVSMPPGSVADYVDRAAYADLFGQPAPELVKPPHMHIAFADYAGLHAPPYTP